MMDPLIDKVGVVVIVYIYPKLIPYYRGHLMTPHTYVLPNMSMINANACRTHVATEVDRFLPNKGTQLERLLYERACSALPGQGGWDFYELRKLYKRLSVRLLENLSFPKSSLRDSLLRGSLTEEDALDLDHRLWESNMWKDVQNNVTVDDQEVVHEGLYPCGYCRSKKMYALNTTDYAKQTRSADEPMTVFLHCHTCGKNYKFSS